LNTQTFERKRPEDYLYEPDRGLEPVSDVVMRLVEKMYNESVWRADPKEYALRGDSNWYRNTYLQTDHWRALRTEVICIAIHRCQCCGTTDDDVNLDVHHLTYERLGFEIPSDLEVLCRKCHNLKHK
jgi:hypothetical protein